MQKIIPHLWFDKEGQEATDLYISLLPNSERAQVATLEGTHSGEVSVLDFKLSNLRFQGINAGPYFHFNETISLFISLDSQEAVDRMYHALVPGGEVLMPLESYDFCPRYAWISDRYGLNWQLMYNSVNRSIPTVRPSLLFSGPQCGQAQIALRYYEEVFEDSKLGEVSYYLEGEAQSDLAIVNYAELQVGGVDLVLMDNAMGGDNTFTEALSFIVLCEDQEEIDYYWAQLSHDPEAEQCGWLKDPFGVSWQIVPTCLGDYMKGPVEAVNRVTQAFLAMKKFDISALEKAYKGE